MALTDLTLVSSLKARMHWHQARQKVLAENVANANMPGFKPRELVAPRAADGEGGGLAVERTNSMHLASTSGAGDPETTGAGRYETRPSGNAVSLEDEMMKSSANQSDYALAATLYQKSLALLRTAAGAKGA